MFDIHGRNIGAAATGANLTLSSQYADPGSPMADAGSGAHFGGDILGDPYNLCRTNEFVNAACVGASDYYEATFSAAAVVSSVVFVNRLDDSFGERIVAGSGVVQLVAADGTADIWQSFAAAGGNGTVSRFVFAPVDPPAPPEPVDEGAAGVRYVRITAAPGQCLHFHELYVFDASYTNVAAGRNATSSGQAGAGSADAGVDGVIDMDETGPAQMVNGSACDGSAWWTLAAPSSTCRRSFFSTASPSRRKAPSSRRSRGARWAPP